MLAIRMQRTGRKGYASFRVIVQDSRFAPTSGRVVAKLGHHNPHTKETVINKEMAEKYLSSGAQPSPRVVRLFELEKIKMPEWVEKPATDKKRSAKNPEKLRKNQPDEPAQEPAPEAADKSEDSAAPQTDDTKAEDESSADDSEKTEDKPTEAEDTSEATEEDDSKAEETEKSDDTPEAEQK